MKIEEEKTHENHDLFCKTKCLSFDFLEQRTRKQLYTSSYKYYLIQRQRKADSL